jgi:hypothetical protein
MCQPDSIHPEARDDRAAVLAVGSVSQRTTLQVAWSEAHDACVARSVASLTKGQVFPAASMYLAVQELRSLFGATTRAEVVVGSYAQAAGKCIDLLACDATGSGWILGPTDPQVRAAKRV